MGIFILVLKIFGLYVLVTTATNLTYYYVLGGKKRSIKRILKLYGTKTYNEDADIDPRWETRIK